MKRSGPLKRNKEAIREWKRTSKPLSRSTKRLERSPIRPVGKRRAKLKQKQFGEQADRCRELPCCVCGDPPPSDPHHVVPRSRGGKDEDCVPLCRSCHREGHATGWQTFEDEHEIDLAAVAAEVGEK